MNVETRHSAVPRVGPTCYWGWIGRDYRGRQRSACILRSIASTLVAIAIGCHFSPSAVAADVGVSSLELEYGFETSSIWNDLKITPSCSEDYLTASDVTAKYTVARRYEAALKYLQCIRVTGPAIISNAVALARSRSPSDPKYVDPATVGYVAELAVRKAEVKAQSLVFDTGGKDKFLGISFGTGVGVRFAGSSRVVDAKPAADGTLRALETKTQEPIVILESHYYGICRELFDVCKKGTMGVGPFFGVVGSQESITALALGIMVGFKPQKEDPTYEDTSGFSMGLGGILESGVKSLAPGFEIGKPLPPGEADAVFVKKSRWGVLLFFSRTF